ASQVRQIKRHTRDSSLGRCLCRPLLPREAQPMPIWRGQAQRVRRMAERVGVLESGVPAADQAGDAGASKAGERTRAKACPPPLRTVSSNTRGSQRGSPCTDLRFLSVAVRLPCFPQPLERLGGNPGKRDPQDSSFLVKETLCA